MQITKNDLGKNQTELTIEVSVAEIKPHLTKAANQLSQKTKIPGFRPGKAPYDLVKSRFGEMAILQAALDDIVNQTFFRAVTQEKLMTVGRPEINIEKLAPENPIVYKAKVSLLPNVVLGDWKKLNIKKKEAKTSSEDIEKTLKQLQELNVKETRADRQAKSGDKLEVDFEASINKAIIEGGKSYKYPVVIGEQRMIPGFENQLIGLKAGEEKEFDLKFPEKYFQTHVAGKNAHFKVKVISVFDRELPKLDDAFAKNIGFDTLMALKEQLEKNITQDKISKENQRVESEAIQEIIKLATINDIPEILVDNEIHKMIHELEDSVRQQGMDMAGYLKSINKTHKDFHTDFRKPAIERIKAALVLRKIANEEKVNVSVDELNAEITKQEQMYKDHPEALANINSQQYKDYLTNVLLNQKVIKLITEKIIK
ncbi:MAG: trigger factor [Patescibacteria group bacterium]